MTVTIGPDLVAIAQGLVGIALLAPVVARVIVEVVSGWCE